ncbi:ABC transporter substrate-binding protein [Aliifodinibius sp. S!AR15-10]|uniref:ABC transporter substrate-binding protein n=1 Tax=Aliifodinibius sp. S!AR15-10 TaxID=2950437 RepID=UPI0028542CFF|nr:ABC transporter substrate-binding protein [Aliifodinibius sp. S!AR15-10]MDR8392458.1 ABC transporter substrate-binding protein [Aliifodinibius sp. S!AR15-10]
MKLIVEKLLGAAFLLLLIFSCAKQPETIVIDDAPESPQNLPEQDSLTTEATESADFKQLIIGELHPISTLDPLFADNNSAKRTIQILYEGLVDFNEQGDVIPALAKRWRVTGDSLAYVFTLRNDRFFHDSDVFSNGLGRKVMASDVKFAFERMARNTVPDAAARLFMAIDGFEPYFQEQHNVLNPAYREIEGVSGIQASNDTTVVFQLAEKDPHFLQKMASPYASVYPREAIKDTPQNFDPVGTGPFQLSQQIGDSVYVFSENQDYNTQSKNIPLLDRVDVIVEGNESNMLQALAAGTIHVIPEVGPQTLSNILNTNGNLSPAYATDYNFSTPGGTTTYSLRYNPNAVDSNDGVRSIFAGIDYSQISRQIPNNILQVMASPDSVPAGATYQASTIFSTYSEDPYQRWFLQKLANLWQGEPKLQIIRIRTPSRHTALYTTSSVPFYPGQVLHSSTNLLTTYTVKQSTLTIKNIQNLQFNQYPWWINLNTADMPGIDQL